jgi:glycosyltransferase involved in cell wall biosynthesis
MDAAIVGTASPAIDVALLVYDLRASGVCRNTVRLAEALQQAGLRVEIVAVSPGGDMAQIAASLPVRHLRKSRGSLGRLAGTLTAVAPVQRYLQHHRPAVLLSMGNHIHPVAALALALAKVDTRLIMRASNDLSHDRPGQWWSPLWRLAVEMLVQPLLRLMFSRADRIIAVSEDLKRALIEDLGFSPEHIAVIPNGVDLDHIQTQMAKPLSDLGTDDSVPTVVGMGRLHRQKNFEGLIRATALANVSQPMRLVILGKGSAKFRRRLVRLAASLGIADRVVLAGYTANPFALLARADLFVLSSSWEGASNALLEAMACGCPVVATRCPTGTVEMMDHGRAGPLVPVEDDVALAEAMLARLAQPRGSANLIAHVRRYDGAVQLRRYVHLLRGLLGPQMLPVKPDDQSPDQPQSLAA